MRKVILFLMLLTLAGCAGNTAKRTSDFCLSLDPSAKFGRCETTEVVCYSAYGALQCWPKPTPSAAPAAPAAVPTAVPAAARVMRNPSVMKLEAQK